MQEEKNNGTTIATIFVTAAFGWVLGFIAGSQDAELRHNLEKIKKLTQKEENKNA